MPNQNANSGSASSVRRPRLPGLLRFLPEAVLGGVALLLLVWLIPALIARSSSRSRDQACEARLQVIYAALQKYRADHNGEYPTELVPEFAPGQKVTKQDAHRSALAPRYVKDLSLFVCPSDPNRGEHGLKYPCSYEYQLNELKCPFPNVRQQIKRKLITTYGSRLRLVLCPGLHRGNGFITLRADGKIGREEITDQDPLVRLRRSFWKMEQAEAAKLPPPWRKR